MMRWPSSVDAIMKQAGVSGEDSLPVGWARPQRRTWRWTAISGSLAKGEAVKSESLESSKRRRRRGFRRWRAKSRRSGRSSSCERRSRPRSSRWLAATETEPLHKKMQEERETRNDEYREKLAELDDVKDPIIHDRITLLTDAKYRELQEQGRRNVFSAGMGAEAALHDAPAPGPGQASRSGCSKRPSRAAASDARRP